MDVRLAKGLAVQTGLTGPLSIIAVIIEGTMPVKLLRCDSCSRVWESENNGRLVATIMLTLVFFFSTAKIFNLASHLVSYSVSKTLSF